MLRKVLIFNLILCPLAIPKRRHKEDSGSGELGSDLISVLRNDANLDLSMDEEYEDLRAELLAYHTALASITGDRADDPAAELPGDTVPEAAAPADDTPSARRSMKTTPCWKLGGICIYYKLCKGHRFLSEVPGCKDKLEVCCFAWNKYQTRDFKDKGISNMAFPWSHTLEFGGKGIISPEDPVRESDDNTYVGKSHQSNPSQDNTELVYDISDTEPSRTVHNTTKQKPPLVVILRSNKK